MRKRLTTHKDEHFRRQMMILGGGILIIVLYLAIFGLNSLINISSWFGGLVSGNNSKQTVEQKEQFFGTLFVDDLPRATNSAQLIVSGSTSNFETVDFKINGKVVESAQVMNQDSFSEKIGSLKEGENTIQVVAKSKKENQTKSSDSVTVVYKKSKPKLTINEPSADATVSSQEVTIKGSTDPDATVEVDGSPVVVNRQGSFQTSVRLKEGENIIPIIALDEATNEEKIEFKLTYKKDE